MQINIVDPQTQSTIFSILFLMAVIASIKNAKRESFFDISLSNELKGFAILAIIFSHIGYFLSKETQFLFPLSVLAGVGVNIFLFLSGLGLTASALKTPVSIFDFYKKRLSKLFLPMWIAVAVFFTIDFLLLHKIYDFSRIIQSLMGFFPRADLWMDLNSPLWYFSLILFYYLIFPLLFFKKFPVLSVLAIFLTSYLVVLLSLPIDKAVLNLYKVHVFAFPLGMLFALIVINGYLKGVLRTLSQKLGFYKGFLYIFLMPFMGFIFGYTAIESGIGQGLKIEQTISLVTMFALIAIFLMKKINFRLFSLFGIYSYEIYLIHWPVLSRYDLLYKSFPAWFATIIYLVMFLVLGFCLQKVSKKFLELKV